MPEANQPPAPQHPLQTATWTTQVELTPGQYTTLIRLTTPHECQTQTTRTLRTALESAALNRHNRRTTHLTDATIETAEYILALNAVTKPSKEATLHLNRFRRTYQNQLSRQRLLSAQSEGAAIRERRTHKPATFQPRTEGDPKPWVVWEPDLNQEFRLPSQDCIATPTNH
ncbi:hypothetical protein [Streptomyces sp. NPDC001933]|uniref:hypothetical protein n=1 Tax=Streptomyces sp. NPDC001933 TaxID=3364626 RepID=UPI0036C7D9E1